MTLIKIGPAVVKSVAWLFLLSMLVIFVGRLFNVWDGDPLVPLLFLVVITTNSAIYQVVLGVWQALGNLILVQAPPTSLKDQIEGVAQQN